MDGVDRETDIRTDKGTKPNLYPSNSLCQGIEHSKTKVKSGNFGHQVNSDIHLQTLEIQIIWIFIVYFDN